MDFYFDVFVISVCVIINQRGQWTNYIILWLY